MDFVLVPMDSALVPMGCVVSHSPTAAWNARLVRVRGWITVISDWFLRVRMAAWRATDLGFARSVCLAR